MQDGDITGCLVGFVVVLVLSLGYAWFELFRLWKRHFHRKPISGVNQLMKLLAWLLFLAFVVSVTMFFSGVFAPF